MKVKIFKKFMALVLVVVLSFCAMSVSVSAQDNTFTVKMINYNVAGLPTFDGTDSVGNHKAIANYIVENNFDIVAVQEDFTYHYTFKKGLKGYDYQTIYSGVVPGGDGLNIFTESMALYNEERVLWDILAGGIVEGDILTAKGILYTVIEIADGVYVDFYNIHADAFDTPESQVARKSNFNQLVEMVEKNYEKNNRPVIITGDFNEHLHAIPDVEGNMYEIFHERCSLKDAWVELNNGGNYHDFSSWQQTGVDSLGAWDSIEKFLYKDGGGVTVKAVDFKYTWVKNSAGEDVSDHSSAECVFEFTVTEDFVENTQELEVVEKVPFRNFFNTIKWIIKDVLYFLSHLEELFEFLG